ncbi:MAG TPA: hypothetical protein VEA69_09190 [Tepidisphaeraceae bacterium]|nr:hypothetical protein [Tepidisphaeraceae bacterium]
MSTSSPISFDAMVRIFRALGVRDPESWARSQADEGSTQLARALFLKQAWADVVPEDDHAWMQTGIAAAERDPDEPFAGAGRALKRMLASGVDARDITDLVRAMQGELLASICYLLGDAGSARAGLPEGCPDVKWELYEQDDDYNPAAPISCLHEDVLGFDPTGREMRPRPRDEK